MTDDLPTTSDSSKILIKTGKGFGIYNAKTGWHAASFCA